MSVDAYLRSGLQFESGRWSESLSYIFFVWQFDVNFNACEFCKPYSKMKCVILCITMYLHTYMAFVMFCRSLLVLLYFFYWALRCLSFFSWRIPISPLVYSNYSYVFSQSKKGSPCTVKAVLCDLRSEHWNRVT